MAVGEVGSTISQRLLLPRDLHLPWVVACGACKSHRHLNGMGAAVARSALPVLPGLSGDGRVWDPPAKNCTGVQGGLTVMGNAWKGGGPAVSLLPNM